MSLNLEPGQLQANGNTVVIQKTSLSLEPGQIFTSWQEFKTELDSHSNEHKVLFNIGHAKTIEQANRHLKKPPFFPDRLKYASIVLRCKHYGSYTSISAGLRPKQRSYKINCQAFISVSACRKEEYLIIRDSCHLHSHPCTEEIYNSYPEVRRMSKDEKNIVGTLMDMGVPVAQIKTTIGRNVTPKDLQNARFEIRRLNQQGSSVETSQREVHARRTYAEMQSEHHNINLQEDEILQEESESEGITLSPAKKIKTEIVQGNCQDDEGMSETRGMSLSMQCLGEEDENDPETVNIDTSGLSGLLAAAGVSSDSVVLTVDQTQKDNSVDEMGKMELPKNSYTVTISLPDRDITQTGTDLQELLKSLPLNKLEPPKEELASSSSSSNQHEITRHIEGPGKSCERCESYMSLLDGHNLCLQCLGPDHLLIRDCVFCDQMRPGQLSIRRKQLVRQRMKALKTMQDNRQKSSNSESHDKESSQSPNVRKSQRCRKPKDYGPDMEVESVFVKGYSSGKDSVQDISFLKNEPEDEYELKSSTQGSEQLSSSHTQACNSDRFVHMLHEASMLDEVVFDEDDDGSMMFLPSQHTFSEFSKPNKLKSLPAIPHSLGKKYHLHQKFESKFCAEPPSIPSITDPGFKILETGLQKLTKNSVVQSRLAINSELFTRLGVNMAEESLTTLGDLYSKVHNTTEISQEELTNDLQTALDTILALKDVVEEIGIMSADSIRTAALQRTISFNSLTTAKALSEPTVKPVKSSSQRRKFQPFSRHQLPSIAKSEEIIPLPSSSAEMQSVTLPSQYMKHLVVNVSSEGHLGETSNSIIDSSHMQVITPDQSQTHVLSSDQADTPTLISVTDKEFSVTPFTLSSELLQTLQNSAKESMLELGQGGKDNVIHLHQGSKELLETLQTNKELLNTLQGGKEGILELGGKDLLQTLQGKDGIIEIHQQSVQGGKENVIELHIMKDSGAAQLLDEGEPTEEIIHTQAEEIMDSDGPFNIGS